MKKNYACFTQEQKKALRYKFNKIALASGGKSAKYVSLIVNGVRPIRGKLSLRIFKVCLNFLEALNMKDFSK